MRFTASAFLGMALLLFGNVVWAQAPPVPPEETAPTEEEKKQADAWTYLVFEDVLQRSCEDPTLKSAIALPKPLLNVEFVDDNTIVLKGRLGMEMGKRFVASVDVKSPFSSRKETTLADQNGLSKGSTLDLKLSWFAWKPRDKEAKILKMIQEWASEQNQRKAAAGCNKDDDERTCADKLKRLPDSPLECDNNDSKSPCAYKKLKSVVGPPLEGKGVKNFLDPAIPRPSAIAMLGTDKYNEVKDKYRDWLKYNNPMIPVFTIKAHGDQKDFEFFVPAAGPPAGLKKTSESHQNYHVTGSLGAYILGNVYASLNYSRGREYVDGAKKDFCVADNLTGVLSCKSLTLAPPQSQRMEVLELEVRGWTRSLGFGLHLTRDQQAEFTKVEIPVYLLQPLKTSKMELNLGARLQWRSDTRKYAVSVFLGPTFSSVFRMGQG